MRCDDVDRWLDDGLATPAPAPPGFTDRVMARIAQAPAPASVRMPQRADVNVEPALPWWIEVTAEPVAAMALVVAALVASQAPAWLALAPARIAQIGLWLASGFAAAGLDGRVALSPFQAEALGVALLPPAILLGFPLYRLAQRIAAGRAEALSTAP